MKYPDFIVVGFAKCGTGSLIRNLGRHPDIHTCDGEPHYWSQTSSFSKASYKALFPIDKLCGEKSPNYIESCHAMARIKQKSPNTKIIVCIRHPIQALHSQFHHDYLELGLDPSKTPFEEIVLRNSSVVNVKATRRCYIEAIEQNLLRYFDDSQWMIVIQERMLANTLQTLNRAFDFLGISHWQGEFEQYRRHDDALQYKSIKYDTPSYREAVTKLLELYQRPNARLFKLLGEQIDEWRLLDDHYRRYTDS